MKRWASWTLCGLALLGVLAPLIANDLPLVARVDGSLRSPAFESYWRDPAPPEDAESWKRWWIDLSDESGDWAVMPPWPYGPFEVLRGRLGEGPSSAHPCGIDDAGRDQLSRLLHGAWTALLVASGAVAIAAMIGCLLGTFGGLGNRLLGNGVLRLIEIFTCFPALVAVFAVSAFLGGSRLTVILVLAAVQWTAFARVVRGELLSLRERPFVEVARGLGAGPLRLLSGHLLPSLAGPILVTAAFLAAQAIVVESTLTFLGLGTGLRTVSWGAMLQQGKAHAWTGAWHLWFFPALALALTVLSLHSLADRNSSPAS